MLEIRGDCARGTKSNAPIKRTIVEEWSGEKSCGVSTMKQNDKNCQEANDDSDKADDNDDDVDDDDDDDDEDDNDDDGDDNDNDDDKKWKAHDNVAVESAGVKETAHY